MKTSFKVLKTAMILTVCIITGGLTTIVHAADPVVTFDTDFALPSMPTGDGSGTPVCIDRSSGLLVAGCIGVEGPTGAQGPKGDTGPQGPAGPSGVVQKNIICNDFPDEAPLILGTGPPAYALTKHQISFSSVTPDYVASVSDDGITIHSTDVETGEPCFEFGEVTVENLMSTESDRFIVDWSRSFDGTYGSMEAYLSFFDSEGSETGHIDYTESIPTRFSLGTLDASSSEALDYSVSFKPNNYGNNTALGSLAAAAPSTGEVGAPLGGVALSLLQRNAFLVDFLDIPVADIGVKKVFPGAITVELLPLGSVDRPMKGAMAGPVTYEPWTFVTIVRDSTVLREILIDTLREIRLTESFTVRIVNPKDDYSEIFAITCRGLDLLSYSPFGTLYADAPDILEMELTFKPERCDFINS